MAKKKAPKATEAEALNPEQLKEAIVEQKAVVAAARKPCKSIRMKHKCMKSGSVPSDKKVAKELAELEKTLTVEVAKLDSLKEQYEAIKPKREAGERNTKYEYPEGLSDAEKKKYRAKMRREAAGDTDVPKKEKKAKKAKEEDAGEGKKEKKSKKAKVSKEDLEEASQAAAKVEKKSKKKGKKKAQAEEDQDD